MEQTGYRRLIAANCNCGNWRRRKGIAEDKTSIVPDNFAFVVWRLGQCASSYIITENGHLDEAADVLQLLIPIKIPSEFTAKRKMMGIKLVDSGPYQLLLSLLFIFKSCLADLPQELDPFLEKLFETTECEQFLSDGSFLAVATRECPPFHCNFPHQLCMRPSNQYQQESSNECRALPEKCLLAANGGQPLSTPSTAPPPAIIEPQTIATQRPPITTSTPALAITTRSPTPSSSSSHGPICDQGPPEGRFCGFSLKFAYNRETRNCDQFWFPGCRTERTNENLFDTLDECLRAVRHCARTVPTYRSLPNPSSSASLPNPSLPPNSNSFVGIPSTGGGQSPSSSVVQPQQPVETQFGQAGQFIRLITNTIRDVRERGGIDTASNQGQGLRWNPSQLTGLLQSFGGNGRRK